MAGTIVLASNTLFSHELLDGYENAYFFDPFKPGELADLMERVITGAIEIKKCTSTKEIAENGWKQVMVHLSSY